MDAAAILDESPRCLLAVRGRREPIISPTAHWFDGSGVWLTTAADAGKVAALRRDPECAVTVPATDDEPGVAAAGRARVFMPAEPVRFALHAPAISAAMSALAARHPGALWHETTTPSRLAAHWPPHQRVVVRVILDALDTVHPLPREPGVSPPLPTALPTDVRRRLGGRRAVMVVWDQPPLRVVPAAWAGGFALAFAGLGSLRPRLGDRVAVAVGSAAGTSTMACGAVLHGELGDGDVLAADRVTWWRGFEVHRSDLPEASTGGLVSG